MQKPVIFLSVKGERERQMPLVNVVIVAVDGFVVPLTQLPASLFGDTVSGERLNVTICAENRTPGPTISMAPHATQDFSAIASAEIRGCTLPAAHRKAESARPDAARQPRSVLAETTGGTLGNVAWDRFAPGCAARAAQTGRHPLGEPNTSFRDAASGRRSTGLSTPSTWMTAT